MASSTTSAHVSSASHSSSISVSGTGGIHSSGSLSTSIDAHDQRAQAGATTIVSGTSNQSFANSTAYGDQTGAGGSSTVIAVSPSGETSISEDSVFTPGATSSHSSASATVTPENATTSVTVAAPAADQGNQENTAIDKTLAAATDILIYHIGLGENYLLNPQSYQDLMIGSEGANTFGVSATGVDSIQEADIIAQFNLAEDSLHLMDGLTVHDIEFSVIDLNGDDIYESTVIRHVQDETILAVALNAVFTTAAETVSPFSQPIPGIDDPLVNNIDYLMGTSSQDVLISDEGQDILIGGREADIFALETTYLDDLNAADILIDFNIDEGDRIHLIDGDISVINDIALETIDLDNNGFVDSTLIRLEMGSIVAIAQGTVDTLGNTLLSTDIFTTIPDTVDLGY